MPRGGARPGAGRKKGTPTRSTVEAREQSLRIVGSTPLDVMLWAIARCVEADEYKDAGDLAAKAAPYMHPKLAPQDAKTINGKAQSPRQMDRDELQHIAASGRA